MWLPKAVIMDVDHVARIYYINASEAKRWNDHRKGHELRMLTGWCWTAKADWANKAGVGYRYGFKTITVAYRDAWYTLVEMRLAPAVKYRASLRRVA